MTDGNNGNDKLSVIDLIDDAVITDTDAVGILAFEFPTTGWSGTDSKNHHLVGSMETYGLLKSRPAGGHSVWALIF